MNIVVSFGEGVDTIFEDVSGYDTDGGDDRSEQTLFINKGDEIVASYSPGNWVDVEMRL